MKREIFESEHDDFRATARAFFETECAPRTQEWEHVGLTDRSVWRKAGELGLLGWEAPEEFGGQDITDFRFNAIMNEEYYATGSAGVGFGLQNDIMASYLVHMTNEEQQKRWLPGFVSSELIAAWRCRNRARDRIWPASRPPQCATAPTTSSTARRPSSAAGSWPTSSSRP